MHSKTTNMRTIYADIIEAKNQKTKLLAVLLDPDKVVLETIDTLISKINQSPATHIFIGGSLVLYNNINQLIIKIKKRCGLPIVLFPGNPTQIGDQADAILFLSLLSGRNPDYLIGHQVQAAPILKKTTLEIIPTAYILIESGNKTAVAKVSKTKPIARNQPELAIATAIAGEMLGNKLVYLEAGSGAKFSVPLTTIAAVAQNISIPLIVGGGIKSQSEIQQAYEAGADLVVIGTAFEQNLDFFNDFIKPASNHV
jgi:phosphoglycerol geranylgeranyltransferase